MVVLMTELRSGLDGWTGLCPDSVQAELSSQRERNDIGSDPQADSKQYHFCWKLATLLFRGLLPGLRLEMSVLEISACSSWRRRGRSRADGPLKPGFGLGGG